MKGVQIALFIAAISIPIWLAFWVGGGYDVFRSPITIILPPNFNGLVCAKVIPDASPEKLARPLQYVVDDSGLLVIENNVIRSHRERRIFRRNRASTEQQPVSANEWSAVFSESDPKTRELYTIFWIGDIELWKDFSQRHGDRRYCIGRF
jgi:hypothetical protein